MKSGFSGQKEVGGIINLKGIDHRMKSAPGKRGMMSAAYKKGMRGEETMDIADEIYEDEESSGDDLWFIIYSLLT